MFAGAWRLSEVPKYFVDASFLVVTLTDRVSLSRVHLKVRYK